MEKIVDIFSDLKNESSRTGKEDILKKHEDNKLFLKVLKFVYNPYIVTGISSKKIKKKITDNYDVHIPITITGLMNYLEENNSGRDVDIYVVQQCLNQLKTKEEKDLLTSIATKNLKVGITEKTINKVYGKGTIPSFSVMLAESFDKKEKTVNEEFYITLKLDGNRSVCIVEDNDVKFYTRQGKSIEDMIELEEQFKELPNGVYDGEILLRNESNMSSDELFRATQKAIRKDGNKRNLEFYIFDTLTISEFKKGESKRVYSQRRNLLDTVISQYTNNSDNIKVLPILYKGKDKSVIPLILKQVEQAGYEGIMINTADGLYKTKRTNDLLKVKSMKSADLLVMSMEEGTGRNEGRLGRINVEYKGGLTGVGSGFTDDERDLYWKNPDDIVGKIVEVQFFEESIDEKTKQPSLRFPVFKCVREDKGVSDIRYS